MNRPTRAPQSAAEVAPSVAPAGGGWHCSHLYYSFRRDILARLDVDQVAAGRRQLITLFDPDASGAPQRLQVSVVSGHKADFGLMLMDEDPLKLDRMHQQMMASPLGVAIEPAYSFVSVTEISEYVPSVEQYAERLIAEGEQPDSPALAAKVKAYEGRLDAMNRQRLTPDFPPWPATCFYPMNKKRKVGENWFTLDKATRNSLMAEHAKSGMQFAGKVSQLITVGLGLDDWEWGVTLWGANPEYLKDIVYQMRFDEASARYAEFGPFLVSYIMSAAEMLAHCGLDESA